MNIKATTKYQINSFIKSVLVFYLVIILTTIFFGIIISVGASSNANVMNISGMEMSTIIFLFVMGLNSFKESFLMLLQNSVTRKTMFVSRLISIFITCVLMSIIDRLIIGLGGLFSFSNKNNNISGLYEMIFEKRVVSLNPILMNLEAVLIMSGLYIAVILVGYLITTAYYRMNKILKVVVSVGVPVTVFIIWPIADVTYFDGEISKTIGRFLVFVFGGKTGNPYNLLISCVVLIMVCIGLSWLLIRNAVEKS